MADTKNITPQEVLWASLAGRASPILPDTETARETAADLEALDLGDFLACCRALRAEHGDGEPEHVSAPVARVLEAIKQRRQKAVG